MFVLSAAFGASCFGGGKIIYRESDFKLSKPLQASAIMRLRPFFLRSIFDESKCLQQQFVRVYFFFFFVNINSLQTAMIVRKVFSLLRLFSSLFFFCNFQMKPSSRHNYNALSIEMGKGRRDIKM